MLTQLKLVSIMGALALAVAAASPALGAQAPSGASETADPDFASRFWHMRMMRAMDVNKDGKVSRDEYMSYMGKQFDMMDHGNTKMLDSKGFTDKKNMSKTFPTATPGTAN